MKKLFLPCLALFAAVLMASCATWTYLSYKSSPDAPAHSGTHTVQGLKKPVKIVYDAHSVPHIIAENEEDMVFATGWVHARERLFQMDLMRHVVYGRLSEMFGNSPNSVLPVGGTLGVDRFFRGLGLFRAGELSAAKIGAEGRALGEAYVAGVNEAMKTGTLPIEFGCWA